MNERAYAMTSLAIFPAWITFSGVRFGIDVGNELDLNIFGENRPLELTGNEERPASNLVYSNSPYTTRMLIIIFGVLMAATGGMVVWYKKRTGSYW